MDFEKAYKSLVAKVKNAHLYAQTDSTKNVLEDIFPELRESEDERIRKKCIELIKRVIPSGDSHRQESKEILDCISYLEKQKEPTKEELYTEAGTTEKEYIANTMKMVRAMREKKQEQKPDIELIQRSWYMEGYHDRDFGKESKWIIKTGDGGPKYEENPKYGQPLACEQKPADKEQDSIAFLEQHGYTIIPPHAPVSIVPSSEATFTEWSEEEKKFLQVAISCTYDRGYLSVSNWLKSLRPDSYKNCNSRWKPSDEQMKVLRKLFIEGVKALTQTDCNTLNSIYLDLKKLM